MDLLTEQVRELYSQYPFPNAEYRMDYGIKLLRFFSQVAPKGRKSYLEGARILDAGCGTGHAITQLAKQFPTSRIQAIDVTPASIRVAIGNAASLGMANVRFDVDNILTMDLGEAFDVVLCFGVLHHLADMSLGLRNLARHLDANGYLVLWLYGKYGRFRLNLNQAMFRILLRNVESMSRRVELTKRALVSFPRHLTACHFNVPKTDIEDDFERSLQFAFENEAWLVDQFLHVNEKTVNIEDILGMLHASGLRLTRWLSVGHDIETYTSDEEVIKVFRELDETDRILALDLLIKPNYYLVVVQKDTARG